LASLRLPEMISKLYSSISALSDMVRTLDLSQITVVIPQEMRFPEQATRSNKFPIIWAVDYLIRLYFNLVGYLRRRALRVTWPFCGNASVSSAASADLQQGDVASNRAWTVRLHSVSLRLRSSQIASWWRLKFGCSSG
jgi:hypothetical protein